MSWWHVFEAMETQTWQKDLKLRAMAIEIIVDWNGAGAGRSKKGRQTLLKPN